MWGSVLASAKVKSNNTSVVADPTAIDSGTHCDGSRSRDLRDGSGETLLVILKDGLTSTFGRDSAARHPYWCAASHRGVMSII